MPSERLRDSNDGWGLSPVEYAHREKLRMRERMKKRAQRARIKITPPPMICELPVDKYVTFRLKGQDIQELGILAYRKYMPNRTAIGIPMTAKGEGDWISLPFLTILAPGRDALSRRRNSRMTDTEQRGMPNG